MLVGYVYNLIYVLILGLMSPWLVWRSIKKRAFLLRWQERWLGYVPVASPVAGESQEEGPDSRPSLWLHAVSVGEVNLLGPMVRELRARYPDYRIIVSSSTSTGLELAQRMFPDETVIRCPFDFTWAHRNVLKRFRVRLIVLCELELWPNWLRIAKRFQVPVAVINGRLSAKSYAGYRRVRAWIRPMFGSLSYVAVQNHDYRDRFVDLGVIPERIEVTGNIKFDNCETDPLTMPSQMMRTLLGLGWNNDGRKNFRQCSASDGESLPIWVAGSTQDGEEKIVLETYQRLLKSVPRLRLVLVPRHPERCTDIAAQIEETGMLMRRLSELRNGEIDRNQTWQILLGDTIGDLKWLWSLADLAFVGGSFGDRGGQNMIEPLAFGASVAVGPNTVNFAQVVKVLLESQCLVQLQEPAQLYEWAFAQLTRHEARTEIGLRSQRVLESQRGALKRTLRGLEPYVSRGLGQRSAGRIAA